MVWPDWFLLPANDASAVSSYYSCAVFAVSILGVNLMLEGLKRTIEDLQWRRKKYFHPASLVIVAVAVSFCFFAVHKFSDDFAQKEK